MARFYTAEFQKDFDCPNCGREIEVETEDIELHYDNEVYGQCPYCKVGIKAKIEVKVEYEPEVLKDIDI